MKDGIDLVGFKLKSVINLMNIDELKIFNTFISNPKLKNMLGEEKQDEQNYESSFKNMNQ